MRIRQIRNRFNNFSWKRALVSLGIAIAIILGGGSPFLISNNIIGFLAYSAIVVGAFATYISIKSLQLARATQRPFLNVLEPVYASVAWATTKDIIPHQSGVKTIPSGESCIGNITVAICNTGVFPADEVAVDCAISRNKKNAKNHGLILDKANPSVYFPGGEIIHVFRETPGKQKLALKRSDVLRILITISYKNKLTQKKHKTVRSYLLKCDPTAQSIIPFPEEDYWD